MLLARVVATAHLAAAHFSIKYPSWQANTLDVATNYSQYTQPCAGVPPGTPANRTDWPLGGGSLILDLHHKWTYVWVNLGLGENVTNFNYTLTRPFWNETGTGDLCVPKLALPAEFNLTDGTKASLQVVTVGESGTALYNCADITFRANATTLDDKQCLSSPGVTFSPIQEGNGSATTTSSAGTTTSTASTTSTTSAGSASTTPSGSGGSRTSVGAVVMGLMAVVWVACSAV